jgi:hypothetical protein
VRECFDAYAGTRLTLSRIVRYVEMNSEGRNYDRQAIARIAARERQRRAWAKRDEREAERARKLKWASLVRKSQAVASQAAAMRRAGDKRAPVWERRAGILAAEEARRIEAGEAPSMRLKPKRGRTVEQELVLQEIDAQRTASDQLIRTAGPAPVAVQSLGAPLASTPVPRASIEGTPTPPLACLVGSDWAETLRLSEQLRRLQGTVTAGAAEGEVLEGMACEATERRAMLDRLYELKGQGVAA